MRKGSHPLNRRKFIGLAGILGLPALGGWRGLRQSAAPGNAAFEQPSIQNTIATLIETKVICKQPGRFLGQGTEFVLNINGHVVTKKEVTEPNRYTGWPTIAKTKKGELVVAFSGDRDAHVCPWGKTQLIRSTDNGRNWSAPETINNTPLDDRDAGLIRTATGALLVSWFTSVAFERKSFRAAYERYARVSEKISDDTRKQWLGNWTRRSTDDGKTWELPSRTLASAPHGPIQLQDGRLLYMGIAYINNEKKVAVEASADDGRSWQLVTTIDTGNAHLPGLWEPHMVQLKNGAIVAMIRNEPGHTAPSLLLQTESHDGGKTWTALHNTGIPGYPPHLIQLQNNWLLVAYTSRNVPYSIKACISKDNGQSWDIKNEITLSTSPSRDLGYPASIQHNDGSILTVFYQAENIGEPACLMSTHWKLT